MKILKILTIFVLCFGVFFQALAVNTNSAGFERGLSQYLNRGDDGGLDLTATDSTFEYWIKIDTAPTSGQYMGMTTKHATNIGWRFLYGNSGATLDFDYYIGNGSSNSSASFAQTLTSATWYHIVWTYDTTAGTLDCWIATQSGSHSRILNNTSAITGGLGNNSSAFEMGADVTNNFYLDGQIDDFRMWSEIRSEAEMNANFEKELSGSETNLVAYWKLNNSLLDETAADNDLTNNNSVSFPEDPAFVGAAPATIPAITSDLILFGF